MLPGSAGPENYLWCELQILESSLVAMAKHSVQSSAVLYLFDPKIGVDNRAVLPTIGID